ncbi:type II secretion system protein [Microbacterium sp. NPDC089318]
MSPITRRGDEGFGLVEVVIATFLLGVIAVALLPVLWNGIVQSTRQSATATATRELNTLIEQARAAGTCAALDDAAATQTFHVGTPQAFQTRVPSGFTYSCAAGTAVPITLEAVQDFTVLATVQARVYVP